MDSPLIARFLGDLEDPALSCLLTSVQYLQCGEYMAGFQFIVLLCVAYDLAVLRPAIHLKISNLVIFIGYYKKKVKITIIRIS